MCVNNNNNYYYYYCYDAINTFQLTVILVSDISRSLAGINLGSIAYKAVVYTTELLIGEKYVFTLKYLDTALSNPYRREYQFCFDNKPFPSFFFFLFLSFLSFFLSFF